MRSFKFLSFKYNVFYYNHYIMVVILNILNIAQIRCTQQKYYNQRNNNPFGHDKRGFPNKYALY